MGKAVYSNDEEALLRKLWLAGASAKTIACQVGRSKNSVIGKAHRMGLPPHVAAKPEKVAFDELDTVRLPRPQRLALAELLSAHPYGVPAKELGRRVFPDNRTYVIDQYSAARSVVDALSRSLRPYGWACGCLGDRGGVKIFPVKEDAR